jgi:hypothetical protein
MIVPLSSVGVVLAVSALTQQWCSVRAAAQCPLSLACIAASCSVSSNSNNSSNSSLLYYSAHSYVLKDTLLLATAWADYANN